jgi:hypothetical protein
LVEKGRALAALLVFGHHVRMRKTAFLTLLTLILVAPAGAATSQGLYGSVTRSPTKPVCSNEAPCSEPAVHVSLRFLRGATLVAMARTDLHGRYRVRLPRGVYTVRVAGAPAGGIGGRIDPTAVRVRTVWRHQDFDIDTGIR